MARRGLEPMHDEHVNVTPLIDVVMCLIVFFLVVGRLAKDEVNAVEIPKAHHGLEMTDQAGRLVINVVPHELPAGTELSPGQEPPPPDVFVRTKMFPDKLGEMNELIQYLRKEKKETPDLKVVLRADQGIEYDWIAPVLVSCAMADIKNVNFSTKTAD